MPDYYGLNMEVKVKKIYISDLDGTLLRNDATLSEYSRKSLIRLINDGVNFTVASARSMYSMKEILGDLPLKLPIIEFNGSFITDYKTGEHIVINNIENEICPELLKLLMEHDYTPYISSHDGMKNNLYYERINNYGMKWYLEDRIKAKDKRLKQVSDIKKVLNENIICFTVMNKKEKLLELAQYLERRYEDILEIHLMDNQYSPGWYWLSMYDKKATKDSAIKTLLKNMNLEGYETVVFGDNVNDIKMFKGADRAIAVENAKDELKIHATETIGENEADSVVDFIIKDVYEDAKELQTAY